MLKILLLGISASIDSWALGASYRTQDITIPWFTKIIVSFVSMLTSAVAIVLGGVLSVFIPVVYIQIVGGVVLFAIGAKSLWGVITHREEKNYDVDASKTIEPIEGIVLGAVMAADSFCAGISLCGDGREIYFFPLFVGCLTYLFLKLADFRIKRFRMCDYCPGIILALVGVAQIFGL